MVKIEVRRSSEGIITYHSKGHAGSGDTEGMSVCNALSAIEYQFLYSVKGLCPKWSKMVNFKTAKGDFQMKIRYSSEDSLSTESLKRLQGKEILTYQILSRALMIGLEMLKKHHPKKIDVKIIEE